MIYLKKTAEPQLCYIPKDDRDATGMVSLTAFSTLNRAEFSVDAEEVGHSLLYHKVMVSLPENATSGEYEYRCKDEVGILSAGLLVVADMEDIYEYENMTEYEQYEQN